MELDGVFADSYAELVRLRDEGKCRFIGMSGYPLHAMRRAISETDLDVVLNYAHFTLLNTELTDGLLPTADANGTGVINAAAVALGLLTPGGLKQDVAASDADGRGVTAGQRRFASNAEPISRSWPTSSRSSGRVARQHSSARPSRITSTRRSVRPPSRSTRTLLAEVLASHRGRARRVLAERPAREQLMQAVILGADGRECTERHPRPDATAR